MYWHSLFLALVAIADTGSTTLASIDVNNEVRTAYHCKYHVQASDQFTLTDTPLRRSQHLRLQRRQRHRHNRPHLHLPRPSSWTKAPAPKVPPPKLRLRLRPLWRRNSRHLPRQVDQRRLLRLSAAKRLPAQRGGPAHLGQYDALGWDKGGPFWQRVWYVQVISLAWREGVVCFMLIPRNKTRCLRLRRRRALFPACPAALQPRHPRRHARLSIQLPRLHGCEVVYRTGRAYCTLVRAAGIGGAILCWCNRKRAEFVEHGDFGEGQ